MKNHLHALAMIGLLTLLAGCGQTTAENTPVPTATVAQPVSLATATEAAPPTIPISATPTTTETQSVVQSEVDRFLNEQVQADQFSGAVLIAQDGAILVSQGYGLANRAQQIANTPQTKFRLGSLTKSFTALAILQLQVQGKLNVQDLICQYIADCPTAWQAITIHQLLTHTAGVPDLTRFPDYEQTKNLASTPAQTIARFKDRPLDFQPGAQWDYSNSGYILLGAIIEKAAGKTYEAFLQENIFTPLQMINTGYEHDKSQLATGYANATAEADAIDMSIPFAAGGLYSTVEDLYRWDQALDTEQLLPKPLLDTMFTPQATIPNSNGSSYGYGWVIGQQLGRPTVGHNGGIEGFVASYNRFPADKVTIIVLSNRQDINPNQISSELARIVFTAK
ncbi:MAG: serine hydrolase [Chloroflexi bacterium]|nr:serine hydrolase [Chloroflexota bacterium]